MNAFTLPGIHSLKYWAFVNIPRRAGWWSLQIFMIYLTKNLVEFKFIGFISTHTKCVLNIDFLKGVSFIIVGFKRPILNYSSILCNLGKSAPYKNLHVI